MREIKFRGMVYDGSWRYGGYHKDDDGNEYIIIGSFPHKSTVGLAFVKVVPGTVGQFTGLRDKNGREIYEGDKAKFDGRFTNQKFVVCFDFVSARFIGWSEEDKQVISPQFFSACEVIGNIHEAPHVPS